MGQLVGMTVQPNTKGRVPVIRALSAIVLGNLGWTESSPWKPQSRSPFPQGIPPVGSGLSMSGCAASLPDGLPYGSRTPLARPQQSAKPLRCRKALSLVCVSPRTDVGGLTTPRGSICSPSEPEPQEGSSQVPTVCGLTPAGKGSL